MTTQEIIEKSKQAKYKMSLCNTEEKREALRLMADSLLSHTDCILEANREDLENARGKISDVMMDRLALNETRIRNMAEAILDIAKEKDPVGVLLESAIRPNGLKLEKVSVPMGVIAIIYESRPNVTSDAAALTLYAGSACILRAGKEAHQSAASIVHALKEGLKASVLPEDALFLVEDTSRESADELMKASGSIDLLIPRGGKGLISSCVRNATVPVLETGTGICHIYVDESADSETALRIIENAKCSRPSVCNAEEVLLLNKKIAKDFYRKLESRLVIEREARGEPPVELRISKELFELVGKSDYARLANKEDFDTEFLDYVLAVDIVSDVGEAISHINLHSTHHSDAILSRDKETIALFQKSVDSACVYANASTRFTDGGEFGFGAEMGISTQKLHARGPVGLRELCAYHYLISGEGQIR